jgi:hypothetical protein
MNSLSNPQTKTTGIAPPETKRGMKIAFSNSASYTKIHSTLVAEFAAHTTRPYLAPFPTACKHQNPLVPQGDVYIVE